MIHTELPALKSGDGVVLGKSGAPVWSNNTLGIFHVQQVEGGPQVWVSKADPPAHGTPPHQRTAYLPKR